MHVGERGEETRARGADPVEQGFRTPRPRAGTDMDFGCNADEPQAVSKVSSATPYRSRYYLNHLLTSALPHLVEKLSSMKQIPGAKNLGDSKFGSPLPLYRGLPW